MKTHLHKLTTSEKEELFQAGNVIAYEDMANPYREWTIEQIYTDQWGTHAVLVGDGETNYLTISGGFQNGWTLPVAAYQTANNQHGGI